jgi:imidazolonepropionase
VTDAESTPITGTGELTTNDGDDGTYAALNDAALVISGDRVAWTGPASRAPAADRAGRTDGRINTPRAIERHNDCHRRGTGGAWGAGGS